MNDTVKKVMMIGGVAVVVYIIGGVVFSSIGTVVALGALAGASYIGYNKFKNFKLKQALSNKQEHQRVHQQDQTSEYKMNRPKLKEAEADFMFATDSHRKDV